MNNLALVYVKRVHKDEVLDLAHETYRYVIDYAGDNDHLVATEMMGIATLRLDCESVKEAKSAVESAVAILGRMLKENVHLVAAYNAYAAVYMHKGENRKACGLFVQALESIERFYGKNIEYAICQGNMALCAMRAGMPAAREHVQCALDVISNVLPQDDERVVGYRRP